MFKYENYKKNLDTFDKYQVKNLQIDRSKIFAGNIGLIEKELKLTEQRKKIISSAFIGINNTTAPFPTDRIQFNKMNMWTDLDGQQQYLASKAICYVIISKPNTSVFQLGEALAKRLNSVHLCPLTIIRDEIERKTPTGLCLDYNFKNNRVCTYDILLKILKRKVKSPLVEHRGYVISGFPLMTSSRDEKYLMKSLITEAALADVADILTELIEISTEKKKKKRTHSPTSSRGAGEGEQLGGEEEEEAAPEEQEPEEEVAEEEDEPVVVPEYLLDACSDVVMHRKPRYTTRKSIHLEQLYVLFELNPDLIIYVTCPDLGIVTKSQSKFINYLNDKYIFVPFKDHIESEIRWPSKYAMSHYKSHFSNQLYESKYYCKQPCHFFANCTQSLCNFKTDIQAILEKHIKEFDPKLVVKLDGRTTTHQMMYNISDKLSLLPIRPVRIPEPLLMQDPPEDLEEFWKVVAETHGIKTKEGVNFNLYPSPWYNRCPVELKYRRSVIGKPKFAVALFHHVFLMSSLKAMTNFCMNPRPYLKQVHLEAPCRIIVMGTKCSGKTMISECLSWIFDAPIISYNAFLDEEKQKKRHVFSKTILSEIIATIEDSRLRKWENIEGERELNLHSWTSSVVILLKKYISVFEEYLSFNNPEITEEVPESTTTQSESSASGEVEQIDEEPSPAVPKERVLTAEELERQEEVLTELKKIEAQLSFLPFLDNLDQCSEAVTNKQSLEMYAPTHLTKITDKPGTPELGDDDVTKAIEDYIIVNEMQNDLEPTTEELMTEMIRTILALDSKTREETNSEQLYAKWIIDGFPSDPDYWDYFDSAKLSPDYTIALIENKEVTPELIEQYHTIDNALKCHEERFLQADDPLIMIKLQYKNKTNIYPLEIKMIMHDIVTASMDSLRNSPENASNLADESVSFSTSIDSFREGWDSIKNKLEENLKVVFDVELEEKTDVQVVEEVLLHLRHGYCLPCQENEEEAEVDVEEDDEQQEKDLLTYNDPVALSELARFCPVTYYDHGVLWQGKPEFTLKYNNKMNYFSSEEAMNAYKRDSGKYQYYDKPFKQLPPLRVCVMGPIGSGKTSISKIIAKELGLIHVDIVDAVNEYILPKHFKNVGLKYENSFVDSPIEEENVVDFQLDENENLESDILANETELRRMVHNYFERGSPIISVLMQKFIKKIWFEKPFKFAGFVLDGFPRVPADVEDMIACFCIPDLVIDLESGSEQAIERLAPEMFKTWKKQLSEAKQKVKLKLEGEKKEWFDFITKKIVVRLLIDEVIDSIFSNNDDTETAPPTTESLVMDANPTGFASVNANLFTIYNEMVEMFPQPVDTKEWEKSDEARERIEARIEGIYESDDENIQSLKEILDEHKIKIISINSTKRLYKVIRSVCSKLKCLRNRFCQSFFEQTHVLDQDSADQLLAKGFFFLSKFYRMCPVYLYENPNATINPYFVSKQTGLIHPVAHRTSIYFILGKSSLIKFRKHILRYIKSDCIDSFIEYPLRIAVIGPPKCGKSTLAMKIAKLYGLITISKGNSVRGILEKYYWTGTGKRILKSVLVGECIESEDIIKAVQAASIDHGTMTRGFVLDDIPETPSEAMDLAKDGLYPLIIFEIISNEETIIKSATREQYLDIIKYCPPYSEAFIRNRYRNWTAKHYQLEDWVASDYQNLYKIDGKNSKWQCLKDAVTVITKVIAQVHYYISHLNTDIVPVEVMGISKDIFQKKASAFENFCPVCLSRNIIRHSECPVDRKGLVSWMGTYYWICAEHFASVLKNPEYYLVSKKISIPDVPTLVKHVDIRLVYENGICIVTYAENLPSQMISLGVKDFGASYRGKQYLFCSSDCLKKFLETPHIYYDIIVYKGTKIFPSEMPLKKLPHIGYLQQTVGTILTESCCAVNVARPKYPGLGVDVSALIYIGLYLKTKNPLIRDNELKKYLHALKVYEARCKIVTNVGLRLRSMDNPFATYPNCCNYGRALEAADSGTVYKPSSSSLKIVSEQASLADTPFAELLSRRESY